MKCTAVAVAFLTMTFPYAMGQRGVQDCGAPETSRGLDSRYDALVCEGLDDLEAGRYELAIQKFEEAMNIRLNEVPNFMLFSRLALAYWKAGQANRAQEALAKAELSLGVLVGILRCIDTDTGFGIVNRYGEPVKSQYVEAITRRMCGAAYDYYYDRESLEEFVNDARLVEVFLKVRETIEGR